MSIPIKIAIPVLAITIVITTFISTQAAPPFVDSGEPEHPECQYTFRPLVNGQCDNSDPAIVEEAPKPIPVAPKPEPSCTE